MAPAGSTLLFVTPTFTALFKSLRLGAAAIFISDQQEAQLGLQVKQELETKEKVKYLEDPANFAADRDDRYNRVLAVAHFATGEQKKGLDLLRLLPRDPQTDAALIQVISSIDEKEKALAGAMTRYESNGLFRCWQAEMALNKGKFEEAAREYCEAAEFSGVRALRMSNSFAGGVRIILRPKF